MPKTQIKVLLDKEPKKLNLVKEKQFTTKELKSCSSTKTALTYMLQAMKVKQGNGFQYGKYTIEDSSLIYLGSETKPHSCFIKNISKEELKEQINLILNEDNFIDGKILALTLGQESGQHFNIVERDITEKRLRTSLEERRNAYVKGKSKKYSFSVNVGQHYKLILAQNFDGTILYNASVQDNFFQQLLPTLDKEAIAFPMNRLWGLDIWSDKLRITKKENLPSVVADFKILDRGKPEEIEVYQTRGFNPMDFSIFDNHIPELTKRHFMGSLLWREDEKYFLLDLDRIELEHKILNIFIVELPYPCETVIQAYNSLIPESVSIAKEYGKEVIRSGEFFFIPTDNIEVKYDTKYNILLTDIFCLKDSYSLNNYAIKSTRENLMNLNNKDIYVPKRELLKEHEMLMTEFLNNFESLPVAKQIHVQNNSPINVEEVITKNGKTYAKGWVKNNLPAYHEAFGEHATINLNHWHEVVSNRALISLKVSGQID